MVTICGCRHKEILIGCKQRQEKRDSQAYGSYHPEISGFHLIPSKPVIMKTTSGINGINIVYEKSVMVKTVLIFHFVHVICFNIADSPINVNNEGYCH